MFDNFYGNDDIRFKSYRYPRYNNIKQYLDNTLYSIKNYYSEKEIPVKRPNMLVTLIESLNINLEQSPYDVYTLLCNNALYIANLEKITTTVNSNTTPFKEVCIDNMDEYFMYVEEDFDYTNVFDILNSNSITTLYSTLDNIFLTHPKHFNLAVEDIDFTIYSIDVIKLGMQYYYWAKNRRYNKDVIDVAIFVYTKPILGIIDSMMDITLFNRFIRITKDERPSKFVNNNVFAIKDFSKDIDKMLEWTHEHIEKNNRILFREALHNIPVLFNDNVNDIISLPDTIYNKRNKWLGWLARVDYLIFLLTYIDSKQNKDYINQLMMLLVYHSRSKVFKLYNENTTFILNEKIDELKNILKRLI